MTTNLCITHLKKEKMINRILTGALFLCVSLSAQAQAAGGITPQMLKEITAQPEPTQAQKALRNAVLTNNILALAAGDALRYPVPATFSIETQKQSIHDQKSSGRCWMFSGMNVLRSDFALHNEGKAVEFSQGHLFFWDQLEKANLMLQGVIDTGKKDIDDPEVQFLFGAPLSDGGTFCGIIDLVEKYGLVPQSVVPETFSSENTSQIDRIMRSKLREYGLRLRSMIAGKKTASDIEREKTAMLKEIYRILATAYGTPVESFEYAHVDAKGNRVGEKKRYTPKDFAKECGATGLAERYLMVMNDPRHEYHKVYEIEYDRHTYDGHNWRYLNLPMDEIEALAIASLKGGQKMYSSYDTGKYIDRKRGFASLETYNFADLFETSFPMDKAQRLMTRESASAHAMTLTAVDLDEKGKARFWKVENSWGADSGQKGYLVMTDGWFQEYMFRLVVEKKYAGEKLLKEAEQKPVMLKYDDILF